MTRYLKHPALRNLKIGQESNIKDRRLTIEEVERRKAQKRLQKKRKR
ncbi:hypothetical protein [Streptococcus merionis]|uniref:Uncharacterized protein n=1 Tax=Streptococcus merionis TaxID=400065 RepID=A0A239SZD3_9STRE|nr:hypothetical protein [Streptococcus merionis]QBX08768.1 hypothetical protein JavanS294_0009 [Streptococcus satellite phage Javan294]SNU90599.1 Uncharacterised protein [Streptococcus merionis]